MNKTQNNIGRLNVAMFKDKKTGKPQCLQGTTPDGVPIWAECRIIDGTLYQLDSTHATMDDAIARQNELRLETSAQAYSSARAKFTLAKGGLYKAAIAAVYKLPYRGAKGIIVNGRPTWPTAEDFVPLRRGSIRQNNVVTSKSGARIVARPRLITDEEETA